jgi:hypothetical protein
MIATKRAIIDIRPSFPVEARIRAKQTSLKPGG